ncbi:hypothetical protein [Myroides odoratimimus]|uniref:hypothetical protein n=1 Tax=Myroides odoratimimus TaxID=76832 RepID=UPI00257826BA|nr:hypothetical protein [Myroides odoratimimus]MDM1397421.1 hypothetical protein [Myroides odoratimimus]MDM1529364.1 hypothetical protein [Myroides odoratimimus]
MEKILKSCFRRSSLVKISIATMVLLLINILFIILILKAKRGDIGVSNIESAIAGGAVVITILVYSVVKIYPYLNKITIDSEKIYYKKILGQEKVIDIAVEDVQIHIDTLYVRWTNQDGYIEVSSGKKKIKIIESYYKNYEALKEALIALA